MGMNMKATTAVAVAFATVLNALAPTAANAEAIHPILDGMTGATAYAGRVWGVVADSGVPLGEGLGRAGTQTLEAALKQPKDRPSTVYYPANLQGIGGAYVGFVIPPQSMYAQAPIGVCIGQSDGQNSLIVWKGHINPDGNVLPDSNPAPASAADNPCKGWLVATGKQWLQPTALPVKARVLTGEKFGATIPGGG